MIAGLTPSTALGNFSEEIAGRNVDSLTSGESLTITSVGGTCSTNYVTCGDGGGAGSLVVYTLPSTTYGFNLTNITVDSGWQDNGRDAQAYTVSYSTVVNPALFMVLTPVNYNPSVPGSTASANQVILADSAGGLIASNVAAIQFDFTTPSSENGYCGYGAITVQGTMATNLIVPPAAPIITGQPQSITLYAGVTLNFAPTITGSPPLSYQWQFISNNITNAIAGATNAILTINNLAEANAGSYQLLVTNSLGHTESSLAALSIITPVPGSYECAVLANSPLLYWKLDETNNPASGGAVAYDYVNGYNGVYQTGAQNGDDGILGLQPPMFAGFPGNNTAMETFANTPNSYMTASVGNMFASNLTYAMWIYPTAPAESYAGLLVDRGAAGEGFGFGGVANASGMYDLDYIWNQNTTSGFNSYLFPPINQWSFVAMVLSPAQAVLYLFNSSGFQAATNAVANDSEEFGVAWHLGDDGVFGGGVRTFPGIIDAVAVFKTALGQNQLLNLYYNGVGAPPQTAVPTASPSTNLFIGDSVVLSELAQGATPVQYQWESNGFSLAGATNSSLLLSNLTMSASGNYQVIVSNIYGEATSAPVTLAVTLDTNPPVVLRAFNIGTTSVELDFSKTVEVSSATNTANYLFTDGLAITTASLATNNSSVVLTTGPMIDATSYSLVINGVRDRAIPPNTIASNTLVSFTASPFAPLDIGTPAIASTDIYTNSRVIINSAGNNIGGTSDQFNFDYEPQTGNFDVTVCLAGMGLSELWAQAGLMARASLASGSPFAAALATPGINGDSFVDRVTTNGASVSSGNFPVNYPHTWLRLNRVGNVFTGFGGYDGTNWTQLGTATISMPTQIYLGFAVASDSTNQLITAQFVNFENTPTNAVVATQVNPHDAIGPSSRMTPIVFSEIMWKPAPRTDGKNLEYLEIYNSNPWFQDISSYQVTCADMNYRFATGATIPGGGYLVLAAAPADIESVYGITNVLGPYNGSLKHAETLELLDEQSNVLLTVPYTDVYPWPVATDGTGHSLILANPTYGEGDPRAWDISDVVGGSPGGMDGFTPSLLRNVVINEILPHSENPAVPQFIELYNHSTSTVDVSGCILTDDPATNEFVIPAGTVIGPAGFVSFTQSQFGFTLNGEGETLYFIKPDGSRILDAVQFGAQADGVSYGRWPDGANDFYAFTTNTPGTNNSTILIGDIVINELMYDP
ncbi:MAG TPA: lamin tail domain-containing protein, partial [Verrucomicrobiae bacterium]|nr:lamin tail domain-containing protein [Verrucomicrobiae bacterium]